MALARGMAVETADMNQPARGDEELDEAPPASVVEDVEVPTKRWASVTRVSKARRQPASTPCDSMGS